MRDEDRGKEKQWERRGEDKGEDKEGRQRGDKVERT
jgi:hypothetical protein